jgi:glycosyltransferase involved in cell wall biosynthesis
VPSESVNLGYSGSFLPSHHVVPNPVDIDKFLPNATASVTDLHLLLCVGQMRNEKGHLVLLQAFASIAPEFPEWNLRFVGEGELREQLERKIVTLRLQQRVQLACTSHDVRAEYVAASIVALPSYYESFGLVAAEALASGRAVIGFEDCQGIAEMIENGQNGMLIEPGEDRVASLANGLRQLMSDSKLRDRLGKQGPRSVQRFALEDVVTAWENLLAGLVARNRRGEAR